MTRRPVAIACLLLAVSACAGSSRPGRTDPTPRARQTFERPPAFAGEPCGLEVTPADAWILTCSGGLIRVPKDGTPGTAIHLGGEVLALDGLAATPSVLWGLVSRSTGGGRSGSVVPVDPASATPGPAVDAGRGVPMSGAAVGDALWVATIAGRLLSVEGGRAEILSEGDPLTWVASAPGEVWTVTENGDVMRRDPATGDITARFPRAAPEAIATATAYGAFWAATPSRLIRFRFGAPPEPVAIDGTVNAVEPCGGLVWLSLPDEGLWSLMPGGEPSDTVPLDVSPRYLACDGDLLWVVAEDGRLGSVSIPM